MPRALSMDLRRRIVEAYAGGGVSQEEVAQRFDVGVATVVRLWAKRRDGKSLEPKGWTPRPSPVATAAALDALRDLVADESDLAQWQYADRLRESMGIVVSRATVGRMLKKLGLTRKKR